MKHCLVIFLFLLSGQLFATHIVGGEMYYDFLGKDAAGRDIYRVTLKVYRDCNSSSNAGFDGLPDLPKAYITIIGGGKDSVFDVGAPIVSVVPPSINSPCVQTPSVCLEEGIYTFTVSLTPVAGGYHIIYQRCCRNHTVLNLIQPGQQGSTYFTKIPGPEEATGNSSPRFKKFPPLFLCNDLPFFFDHSATDPDGDQLVYSIVGSYNGLDACCPSLNTPNPQTTVPGCFNPPPQCPVAAPLPPYPGLNYVAPYSATYPLASNPALAIDPVTGKLTGKPNLLGQFVVCIQVKEYRNGLLLGTHYRDFQFNIAGCVVTVISDMADQVFKCVGNVITFTNQSVSNTMALNYFWDFGVPNLTSDTSLAEHPTYTYQDTGKYTVTLIGNPGKPCSDTIRKDFYVYPELKMGFPKQGKQCLKNNVFNFELKGTYLSSATFTWNFSASATPSTSSEKNPNKIRFNEPGKFFIKLTGKHLTCIDSFIDTVRVLPRVEAKINTSPLFACAPATIHFSNETTASEEIRFEWLFSNGKKSNKSEPTEIFEFAGGYNALLMAISTGFCKDTSSATIPINLYYPPEAGFRIFPRITSIFDPLIQVKSTAGGGLTYHYSFGDGEHSYYHDAEHVYYDYGNYTITQYVTDAFGCTDSISDIVQILPEHRFWIPTAFTPNDDSRNDVFKPVLVGVSQYELAVFDRWGHLLFKTTEMQEGWNGIFKGVECKQDIYVWKVKYKDLLKNESYEKTGHVTLLKNP